MTDDTIPARPDAGAPPWWQGAVIYHIYPRSYLDTTGNGIGDLAGIARRLDHIAELGADAVWISPFVRSPMLDFGYDVSDYYSVDPMFGTLDDFQELLDAAHERGLRVLMDQVLSHTSDRHPWFLESRESRDNPKADWYVWADPKPDGTPPNNWLSVFGGSSWQWEPRRSQYYLHNFLRQQPDLNFHHPEVQAAVLDVCRYWLDLGVDGFRLDVCAFYFHDATLADNPVNPTPPPGKIFEFNPYSRQNHVRDIARPENLAFLERLRALTEEYDDRVLLGELHESESVSLHRQYTGPGRLQLAYGYWLLGAERVEGATLRHTAELLGHGDGDGWPAWALDNHDFPRAASRLGDRNLTITVLAALAAMRGSLCLYQGSELALEQADVPYDRIVDPYGREFYPAFTGRDGARTPMPWEHEKPHAGFSTAEPWLPVPDDHRSNAVDAQKVVPGSPFNRLSRFLRWRRERPALRWGSMRFLDVAEPCLAFERRIGERAVVCVFNFGETETTLFLDPETLGRPIHGHGFGSAHHGDHLTLPAGGAYFGERVMAESEGGRRDRATTEAAS